MHYTLQSVKESSLLNRTILSSEDQEIIDVAGSLGLEVPFTRPSDLADDRSPTLPVILHALEFFERKGETFDAVCILQLTSPFRRSGMIDEAIQKMDEGNFDSVISMLPVPHEFNPHWIFEPNEEGELFIATGESEIIPRRQELPAAFYRDGGLYLTKTEVLKKNSLYGARIGYVQGDSERHINLDTMADWEVAEKLIKTLFP